MNALHGTHCVDWPDVELDARERRRRTVWRAPRHPRAAWGRA